MQEFFILSGAIIIIIISFIVLCLTKKLKHAPNMLTTTGILCTFIGISWGLIKFNIDDNDLSSSINNLLNGLKFSFIPSAFGVALALISKILLVRREDGTKQDGLAYKSDMSRQEFSEVFKMESKLNADKIVTKFEEHANRTFLQLTDIRRDLKDFKDEVVSNNVSALIAALQEVLEGFNNKISEHLGDNFKALSMAVQNLVIWQDNYKITIENTTNDYAILLHKNKELLTIIESSIHNIEYINQKISSTNEHVVSLTSNIIETHNKLGNAANGINTQIEVITNCYSGIAAKMHGHAGDISRATNTILQGASEANKGIQTNIVNFSLESKNLLQEVGNSFNQQIKSMNNNIHEIEKSVKTQIENLDKALEIEINKSLEGLGKGLTAISGKFVDDYTPLTEKLRQLLRMSEQNYG